VRIRLIEKYFRRQIRRQQREENERREAEAKSASLNPSPSQTPPRIHRGFATPPPIPPRSAKGSAPPVPPKGGVVDLETERTKALLCKLVDLVNATKSGQDDKYYSERYRVLEELIKNGTRDMTAPENGQAPDGTMRVLLTRANAWISDGEDSGEKLGTRARKSSEPMEVKSLQVEVVTPTQIAPSPAKPVERSREELLLRRKYVFDELIETEEHYVNDLKILVRVCLLEDSLSIVKCA